MNGALPNLIHKWLFSWQFRCYPTRQKHYSNIFEIYSINDKVWNIWIKILETVQKMCEKCHFNLNLLQNKAIIS